VRGQYDRVHGAVWRQGRDEEIFFRMLHRLAGGDRRIGCLYRDVGCALEYIDTLAGMVAAGREKVKEADAVGSETGLRQR